jgi:hypothetical protein
MGWRRMVRVQCDGAKHNGKSRANRKSVLPHDGKSKCTELNCPSRTGPPVLRNLVLNRRQPAKPRGVQQPCRRFD